MSLFARDFYNMHRQMTSLFDSMHSAYGLDDIDDFMAPTFNTMPLIDNGQANSQQALSANGQSALTTTQAQANNNSSLFPSSFGKPMLSMSADIHAEPDKYLVSCELPGVDNSSIDISVDKHTNTLSIKAEKRHEFTQTADDNKQVTNNKSDTAQSDSNKPNEATNNNINNQSSPRIIRQERSYGMVQRSIRLSKDADLDNIQAKFDNGVLQLNVPRVKKVEKDEPKKITIQ